MGLKVSESQGSFVGPGTHNTDYSILGYIGGPLLMEIPVPLTCKNLHDPKQHISPDLSIG